MGLSVLGRSKEVVGRLDRSSGNRWELSWAGQFGTKYHGYFHRNIQPLPVTEQLSVAGKNLITWWMSMAK